MNEQTCDVLMLGGGVQGCVGAVLLARAGLRVVLAEPGADLLGVASARNEGWLHHGTYHAALAPSTPQAIQAAEACLQGAAWFRANCPAAVVASAPSVALTSTDRVDELETRWRVSGVPATRLDDVTALAPFVRPGTVTAAYAVGDVGLSLVGLRSELRRLLAEEGVSVLLDRWTVREAEGSYLLWSATEPQRRLRMRASTTVLAVGTASGQLLADFGLETSLRLRIWRSHLLSVPRLPHPPIFFVDYDFPSAFPQGSRSLIGLNSDNTLVETTAADPVPGIREWFLRRFHEQFDYPLEPADVDLVTCHKIDEQGIEDGRRSITTFVERVSEDVWVALPGKLTTAPVSAEMLARALGVADGVLGRV